MPAEYIYVSLKFYIHVSLKSYIGKIFDVLLLLNYFLLFSDLAWQCQELYLVKPRNQM